MGSWFSRFANRTAALCGHYLTFIVSVVLVVVWAVSGPFFGFSDTWQLIVNTFTTVATFLVVFLIQNTQNRDAAAVHLKLDEIIRSMDKADNTVMQAEDETDEELAELKSMYLALAKEHRELRSQLGQPPGMQEGNGTRPTGAREPV